MFNLKRFAPTASGSRIKVHRKVGLCKEHASGKGIQKKRKRTDFEGEINHLIRSHHRGFVFCRDNVNCPGQVKEEAIKALKALSLDYAGIDIKFNKHNNKAFVLEANSSVGLEGQTLENYTNQIMDICENG